MIWSLWLWVVITGALVSPVQPALGVALVVVGAVLAGFELPLMRRTGRRQGIAAKLATVLGMVLMAMVVLVVYGGGL